MQEIHPHPPYSNQSHVENDDAFMAPKYNTDGKDGIRNFNLEVGIFITQMEKDGIRNFNLEVGIFITQMEKDWIRNFNLDVGIYGHALLFWRPYQHKYLKFCSEKKNFHKNKIYKTLQFNPENDLLHKKHN
jgi:hypothetical protein